MQSKSQIKYNNSLKGIQRNIRYEQSKKYKSLRKEYNKLHHYINLFRQYHNFVMENCAICGSNKTECHHPNTKLPLHIYFLCRKHHLEQHGMIESSSILKE